MNNLKPLGLKVQKKSFAWRHKFWLGAAIILVGLLAWVNSSGNDVFNVVFNRDGGLKSSNGQVNVLLLGTAGGRHDGPNLTDTIMVASINLSTHKISLVSIPRDLWLTEHKAKVNTLYQIGLNQGAGLTLAKAEIGKILGLNIPYVVRVDFSGFTKAVDLVGGIDVEVERSFEDFSYPIPGKEKEFCGYKEEERDIGDEQAKTLKIEPGKVKVLLNPQGQIATASAKPGTDIVYTDLQVFQLFSCRFEHLSFKQGLAHMDGELALKFVRSRHGTGSEGSDFARSKRQQLLLQAFKSKILSLETLLNPQKIVELVKTFGDSVDTDIPQSQFIEFAKLVRKAEGVKSYVIDEEGKEPLLVTPPVGQYGAWVLIPPNNDFSRIHQYVINILSGVSEASAGAKEK